MAKDDVRSERDILAERARMVDAQVPDGWETVTEGAAAPWKPELVGQWVEGRYLGSEIVKLDVIGLNGEKDHFTVYKLRGDDGVMQSIANTAMIDIAFEKITIGDYVRVIYKGTLSAGIGKSDMHDFKVVRRAS